MAQTEDHRALGMGVPVYCGGRESDSRPEAALRAIVDLPRQVATRLGGQASTDVILAYAGLAPVPLLVAAGHAITSRQDCLVLDMKRGSGWHSLDAPDDDEALIVDPPTDEISNDLALILSFSAEVTEQQIPPTLVGRAYRIRLAQGAGVDSLASDVKQKRLANALYTLMANLKATHPELTVVHLFIAAQASFCFRLRTILTESVHPSIAIYHYVPSASTYTWGVSLQTGREPCII